MLIKMSYLNNLYNKGPRFASIVHMPSVYTINKYVCVCVCVCACVYMCVCVCVFFVIV